MNDHSPSTLSIDSASGDVERIALFNQTDRPFRDDVTLHELIEEQVARTPDAIAVLCDHDRAFGASSLTFRELNEKANQLAHTLRAEGIGRDQIVGLMVERSFAMMIGILAIIKAGAAYLPIPPDNPPDRIEYLLQDGGVKILLIQTKTAGKVPFTGRIIDLENPETYRGSIENPRIVNRSTDLAYVIYTSGSTGKPKGVMIEHRSVVNRLAWMQRAYPIGAEDVLLQKTPYFFDVSVWELFWWALQGAKLCFIAPGAERIPLAILETIRKHRVSVLHFVPSMLNVFVEYLDGRDDQAFQRLDSVRRIFASGEALTPSHVRKFNDVVGRRTAAKLTNLYGPTEATVDVTFFDCPEQNGFEQIPIGRPIDNTGLHIINERREMGIGEPGELCIGGVGLARGYLNNPSLTAEKFVDHPSHPGERIYRTGDMARWLPDGNVEYLGRNDHQVKIRGLRIELGEIENTIRDGPGVSDCIVTVKKYSESVILIIAYVVPKPALEIDALKGYLKQRLPDYMLPNHYESVERIPLTSSGKADRNALPEPAIQVGRS